MKRDLCESTTTQEYLVADYCEAQGLPKQPVTPDLVDAAVRHMHKTLLGDLRPPWVDHQIPQALPGVGVLSRFTRPSFLQWIDSTQGLTRSLFGHELSDSVLYMLEHMGLKHAGFVARPLYVCTSRFEHGQMCMNVASMSKFIRLGDGRSHYRCRKCADRQAPVSDSAPLRVLDVYTLVRDGDSKPTLLRRAAYRLRLRAPPYRWAWGEDMGMGCGHDRFSRVDYNQEVLRLQPC